MLILLIPTLVILSTFQAPGSGLRPQMTRGLSVFPGLFSIDIHSGKEFMSLWDYLKDWTTELSY
jgi:hypothetical protein